MGLVFNNIIDSTAGSCAFHQDCLVPSQICEDQQLGPAVLLRALLLRLRDESSNSTVGTLLTKLLQTLAPVGAFPTVFCSALGDQLGPSFVLSNLPARIGQHLQLVVALALIEAASSKELQTAGELPDRGVVAMSQPSIRTRLYIEERRAQCEKLATHRLDASQSIAARPRPRSSSSRVLTGAAAPSRSSAVAAAEGVCRSAVATPRSARRLPGRSSACGAHGT